MSSVLIGIIGIALFMGIAVGSAMYMGPRFDDAQALSVASNSIQAVSAVAAATNAFRMATNWGYGPGLETTQKLVDGGFIRTLPGNPDVPANPPELIDANTQSYATASAAAQATWSPQWVFMSVGSDQAVCTAVMRTLGQMDSNTVYDPNNQQSPVTGGNTAPAGCFRTNANAGSYVKSGDYVIYSRLGI